MEGKELTELRHCAGKGKVSVHGDSLDWCTDEAAESLVGSALRVSVLRETRRELLDQSL